MSKKRKRAKTHMCEAANCRLLTVNWRCSAAGAAVAAGDAAEMHSSPRSFTHSYQFICLACLFFGALLSCVSRSCLSWRCVVLARLFSCCHTALTPCRLSVMHFTHTLAHTLTTIWVKVLTKHECSCSTWHGSCRFLPLCHSLLFPLPAA